MSEIKMLRIPEHVEEKAFRSVLAAVTTAYRQLGRTPTVKEVHAYWPHVTQQAVSEMLALPEMRDALNERGIRPDGIGLSHVQHLLLLALSDPLDKRSTKAKVEAAGATTQQYASWLRDPAFQAARHSAASRLWGDHLGDVKDRMLQQAESGSFQHQQFVMETMGKGPKARELQSAREMIQSFVAAVQRATVGHPEIRERIMAELSEERMAQAALNQ